MDIKNTIKEIFNESIGHKGIASGHGKGFSKNITSSNHRESFKRMDAKRKVEERAKAKRIKDMMHANKTAEKSGQPPQFDARYFLDDTPFKLTLLESFVHNLIEYLNTGEKIHITEAVKLMEEYPKLKQYVIKNSTEKFPSKNATSVYLLGEHLEEEVGSVVKRPEGCIRICNLSLPEAELKAETSNHYDRCMILEAKITPDKILIYIPAFTQLMEKLIFSGKIQAPTENILRLAKQHNEVVLPPTINEGLVVKIH